MTKILPLILVALSCSPAAATGTPEALDAIDGGWREVFSVGHPGGVDVVFGSDVFPSPEDCRRSLASRRDASDLGRSWGRVVFSCLEADAGKSDVDRFHLRSLTTPR